MQDNNADIINQLDKDINYLEELIKSEQNENQKIKLRIQKKELIIQKLELKKIMLELLKS